MKKYITIFFMLLSIVAIILIIISTKKSYLNIYNHSSEKNTINIVYISNQNYVFPLSISMRSAIKNKNKDTKYHFFIIGVELSAKDIIKLKSMTKKNVKISILNQKNIYKNKTIFFKNKKYTDDFPKKADLFKFNITEILPYIDKILYMDCDTIVQKDLSTLFNTDIENVYAGVIPEFSSGNNLAKRFKLKQYFNCGVMLLNLDKMKRDNISKKMYDYRFGKTASKRFLSQDTFNIILYPNYKILPPKYDLLSVLFQETLKDEIFYFYGIDKIKYKTAKDYVYDATIIHFIYDKPWDKPDVIYSELWYKYLTPKEEKQLMNNIKNK